MTEKREDCSKMSRLPTIAKSFAIGKRLVFASVKGSDKSRLPVVCQKNPRFCRLVCQIYPLGYLANVANDSILAPLLEKVVCQSIRIKKQLANDFLGYLIVIS